MTTKNGRKRDGLSAVIRTFGSTPPPGGRTLYQAAFDLVPASLRQEYESAKAAWEEADKPTKPPAWHRRTNIYGERYIRKVRRSARC